ncbi:hypothetical protein VZT92_025166 [Zoarces viviparus]|uniref:Uncharacterized protein n=1 Tax=Zoarces viviparus TaxID=48416 RepID=A0AAW1E506_ZOAVI
MHFPMVTHGNGQQPSWLRLVRRARAGVINSRDGEDDDDDEDDEGDEDDDEDDDDDEGDEGDEDDEGDEGDDESRLVVEATSVCLYLSEW